MGGKKEHHNLFIYQSQFIQLSVTIQLGMFFLQELWSKSFPVCLSFFKTNTSDHKVENTSDHKVEDFQEKKYFV